jgi:hypothetical protein
MPATLGASTNERQYVVHALKANIRTDGRSPYEFRDICIDLGLDDASGRSIPLCLTPFLSPLSPRALPLTPSPPRTLYP